MNRGLVAGVCLVILVAGCEAPPKLVEPFPQPSRASGSWVVLDDRRPDWERAPFTGPVFCLYRFSRVSPNPWVRLQKATEAIVADLPQRPERVDVVVTSFRLVSKEDHMVTTARDAEGNVIEQSPAKKAFVQGAGFLNGLPTVDDALPKGKTSTTVKTAGAFVSTSAQPAPGVVIVPGPEDGPEGPLDGLSPGATCSLRGLIRLTYPGGGDRDVPFEVLAGRPNASRSAYWGETLEEVTRLSMIQFNRQVRERIGLPSQD